MSDPEKPAETRASGSVTCSLDAEAKLMRAAQKFGMAFDENRIWGDGAKRLEFTLFAWKELALSALEFAETSAPGDSERPSSEKLPKARTK